MSNDSNKVIYSMIRVSKHYDKKPVLKNISLSYFYGAKIGVLGLNGSGKTSLLKILAGVDQDFNGETILSEGFTVGYLEHVTNLCCSASWNTMSGADARPSLGSRAVRSATSAM